MLISSLILGLVAVAAAAPQQEECSILAKKTDEAIESRWPSQYWYETIRHNGISPFIPNGRDWKVYRNVKTDFGARGDGVTDDSAAIQAAMDFGNGTVPRGGDSYGTTGAPAVVYIPGGTYLLKKPIQTYINTVIMGDPLDMPVLKAAHDFPAKHKFLWNGYEAFWGSTTNFYIGLKNVVLDSTSLPKHQNITLLDWAVSQAVQLTNVVFNMAEGAAHTGLSMPAGGSPLIMNDLIFQGGSVGIRMNEQQYHFKGLTFRNMDIGLKLDKLFEGTGQGLRFESCRVGVESSNNNTGFFALIDSSASDVDILWNSPASSTAQGSMVIENVRVDSSVRSTVTALGKNILRGSVLPGRAWIWGDVYGPTQGEKAEGQFFKSSRSPPLVDADGAYHVSKPPTYQEYHGSQVINVKTVCGWPVAGDGVTDDTGSLQHIINEAAGHKVLFFPHGTYLLSDTLVIPPGSRFYGEVWSEFSATGNKFKDARNPTPMIQVGQPGEVGVAQFSDLLFTVADILPGCKLVEVNMAGAQAGDVGFFNSHFRIGGARGSRVETHCGDPATCTAARLCAHLTARSSSYWENSWCWSADHDLDGDSPANPSTGGGFLVEASAAGRGTWLLGIGSEHNDLYQMNINQARNVFLGFQQSETPYWQGNGSDVLTPEPWQDALLPSDPDFSWCAPGDAQCRMAVYQLVRGSADVNIYGGGFWTFFNGLNRTACAAECQQNGVIYEDNAGLYSFGVSTHNVRTMVLENEGHGFRAVVTDEANSGGWETGGGVMAAYLRQGYE